MQRTDITNPTEYRPVLPGINQTGDAYIIARQISGSYYNEGRIGTSVFPASSGAAGVSYFDCSISNTGPNFSIYANAANGGYYDGLGTGNTYSYALFAKAGMVVGNDFLINGRRTAKFSLANQYTTIDPSKYDAILINVTSGSESDLYFTTSYENTIKDGKELFVINYGATNNLRLKNIYNTGADIVLDSGQAVVLRAIYKPSLTWWIQSFFDNN